MRHSNLMIALALILLGFSRPAHADCMILDQIDQLHVLQTRLANNPDTALFRYDIRQLRTISSTISNRETLEAVAGNAIMGKGASFVRFLENTQNLLQGTSLDDPLSVQPHFTRAARQNLQDIGGYLTDLRCTDTQIAVDQARAAADPIRGNSDAEDLEEVAEVIREVIQEVFQWRTLLIVIVLAIIVSTAFPLIQRWLILRLRRAKRHNTNYTTQYRSEDRTINGVLMDINCHGTKLRHEKDNPLPKGGSVDICIEGEWTGGTVVWSNVHYSGTKFSDMIALSQVHAICTAQEGDAKTQNGAPKDAVS